LAEIKKYPFLQVYAKGCPYFNYTRTQIQKYTHARTLTRRNHLSLIINFENNKKQNETKWTKRNN